MACFQLTGGPQEPRIALTLDVDARTFSLAISRRGELPRTIEGTLIPKCEGTEFVLVGQGRIGRVMLANYLGCDALCVDQLHLPGRSWVPDLWYPGEEATP